MTISRGVSLIALYLGEIDEKKIYEISYPFFSNLIKEITLQLNYQATSNLLGNAYAGETGIDLVQNSNPINYNEKTGGGKTRRATMSTVGALKDK